MQVAVCVVPQAIVFATGRVLQPPSTLGTVMVRDCVPGGVPSQVHPAGENVLQVLVCVTSPHWVVMAESMRTIHYRRCKG